MYTGFDAVVLLLLGNRRRRQYPPTPHNCPWKAWWDHSAQLAIAGKTENTMGTKRYRLIIKSAPNPPPFSKN